MKCSEVREWLWRDLDGAAEPSADAAAHLERCGPCAAEAARVRAVAEGARDALPDPDVPVDFTQRVMAAVEEAPDLAERARPRWVRWWPVAALVPLAFLFWGGRGPAAVPEPALALAALEQGEVGGVAVRALAPTRFEAGRMRRGAAILRSGGAARVATELAELELRPGTTCLVRLETETEETEMNYKPTVLAVLVLAGGVRVANAQGDAEAEAGEAVRTGRVGGPRVDDVHRALADMRRLLERLERRVDGMERGRAPRRGGMDPVGEDRFTAVLDRARQGDTAAREELRRMRKRIDAVLGTRAGANVHPFREDERRIRFAVEQFQAQTKALRAELEVVQDRQEEQRLHEYLRSVETKLVAAQARLEEIHAKLAAERKRVDEADGEAIAPVGEPDRR